MLFHISNCMDHSYKKNRLVEHIYIFENHEIVTKNVFKKFSKRAGKTDKTLIRFNYNLTIMKKYKKEENKLHFYLTIYI